MPTAYRVVLASVTEGADKPVKYPHMFRTADVVLVSKTDLLPYVDFDLARCAADIAQVSPGARVLPVSARSGDGPITWYDWLRQRISG
jgi:hydrogenase nickel incorporation protein HypB